MYILVLSESLLSSRYLSHGLKYENIHSKPLSIFEARQQNKNFQQFDAVLCKIKSSTKIDNSVIKEICDISKSCPLFLVTDNPDINSEFSKEGIIPQMYPFSMDLRKLAYEIKNTITKKYLLKEPKFLKVADLKLNLHTREVNRFKKTYFLRNKEFRLLEFLMQNTNMVLSRQKILENVWDMNAHLFTNTVDVHINSLRKKLDSKPESRLIETIHCTGYMMHSKPYNRTKN